MLKKTAQAMKFGSVILSILASQIGLVLGHGGHNEIKQKPSGLSWQNWHMIEEHQLDQYDADSFFKIHDLQDKGYWTGDDILYVYGLTRDNIVGDGSGMGEHAHGEEIITQDAKNNVIEVILRLVDKDHDKQISVQEWRDFIGQGKELPDFGYGQGHHLDFESEYEEHHWNEFHANQDPDVQIKHKEDIEHELLHHEHEIEESHSNSPNIRQLTEKFLSSIKLENLPSKYRN